jgi:peptide/nickel transport system substrate-binding protein
LRIKKSAIAAVGSCLLFGATLAACSSSGSSNTSAPSATPTASAASSAAAPAVSSAAPLTSSSAPASSAAPALSSSTLTVAVPADITDFDPSTDQLIEYIYTIRNTVFSALVKYDANLNIVPDLATPSVNADATVYTFKLNPGEMFQDNTPVTADAVIASLKRAGAGKGVYAAYLAGIASYVAPDPQTVVLTLKTSNAAFLDGLVNIAIIAPNSVANVGKLPVGSGPFKFVSATANRQIVLERFDGYFGQKPSIEKLIFNISTDPQVSVNNLYSGQVDAVSEASQTVVSQLNKSKASVVTPSSSNSIDLFEFNSSGKLANPLVRQALATALDKNTINAVVYGGQAKPISSVVPSGAYADTSIAGYPFDLAKAKALLAQAGVTNLSVNLILPTGYPEATQTAKIWQSSLKSIGVTLNITTQEVSVWVQNYIKHSYDVSWNFFNESGDPNSFFSIIMTPHLQDDYKNPAMQALIAKALTTSDTATRTADYAQLASMVNTDLPVLAYETRPLASLESTKVQGLTVNPLGWTLFDNVTVS